MLHVAGTDAQRDRDRGDEIRCRLRLGEVAEQRAGIGLCLDKRAREPRLPYPRWPDDRDEPGSAGEEEVQALEIALATDQRYLERPADHSAFDRDETNK